MTKKALVLFISNTPFPASFLFLLMTLVFFANLDEAKTLDAHLRKARIFKTLEGFKLVGHILETLAVDEYICGQRCLRNEKCLSYNSHSDDDYDNNKCELSDQNRPDKLIRSPGFIYHIKVGKGWYSSYPGHSCKDIYDSGDARGDGEYWIDPEKNGNPLKVFCDMTRAGGGWLLVLNIVIKQIKDQDDLPQLLLETSYRKVDSYKSNNLVLKNSALNDLKTLMPFTQMRFHCRKPGGSTFHIVTTGNSTGEAVIQYFTGQTNTMPDSCGSYIKLWDDNSKLANRCADWGNENGNYYVGKWGHEGMSELYDHPAFSVLAYHWVTFDRWECDDYKPSSLYLPPNETFWKIFVR